MQPILSFRHLHACAAGIGLDRQAQHVALAGGHNGRRPEIKLQIGHCEVLLGVAQHGYDGEEVEAGVQRVLDTRLQSADGVGHVFELIEPVSSVAHALHDVAIAVDQGEAHLAGGNDEVAGHVAVANGVVDGVELAGRDRHVVERRDEAELCAQ